MAAAILHVVPASEKPNGGIVAERPRPVCIGRRSEVGRADPVAHPRRRRRVVADIQSGRGRIQRARRAAYG